jgi:site-specific recombinase XerD
LVRFAEIGLLLHDKRKPAAPAALVMAVVALVVAVMGVVRRCPAHVHMLRHSTGYALAARGMDTRRLQHFLGHASITNTVRYTAMSPEPFKDIWR